MRYVIDRFEEESAICENKETGEMISIPTTKIPKKAKDGDVIVFEDGVYVLDAQQTKVSRGEIQELMDKLKKNSKGQVP